MPAPILPINTAAPLLFLALRKIAHTPRARLQVGYRVVPRRGCPEPFIPVPPAGCAGPTPIRGQRPLGAALLLDRILAGGIVGEWLPMHLDRVCDARPLANRWLDAAEHPLPGICLDCRV